MLAPWRRSRDQVGGLCFTLQSSARGSITRTTSAGREGVSWLAATNFGAKDEDEGRQMVCLS